MGAVAAAVNESIVHRKAGPIPAAPMAEAAEFPAKATPTAPATASEEPPQPRDLRPEKESAISTTLHAVVIGESASSDSQEEPDSMEPILGPVLSLTATAAPVPTVLAPSVITTANAGGILLAPRTAPDFAALQKLFTTNAALDLAGVAALAAALPGVRACVISGAAGDASAGDFSHGVSADEVRAASAILIRRASAPVEILHRGESDIALFPHGGTCVAVILAAGGFVPGVRERLARAAGLLPGAQPA